MKKSYYVIFGVIVIIFIAIYIQKPTKTTTPTTIASNTSITEPSASSSTSVSETTKAQINSLDEIQCKQGGYEWVPVPGLCAPNKQGQYDCGYRCDIKTSDGGKECYSNNECEGACLCSKNEKDTEGFQVGECSRYKYFTEDIDCPCILEIKSKTPNFPYGCT